MTKPVLDTEVLKTQDRLTEEQEEQIQQDVLKQMSEEERSNAQDDDGDDPFATPKAPKKDTPKDDSEKDGQESDEERKAREEQEAKDAEESEKQEAEKAAKEKQAKVDAAQAKEESKRSEDEKALLKEHEEAQATARQAEIDKDVKDYATNLGISEVQARKEVEKIHLVREKYKADPKEMAKALYHLNVKLTQAHQRLSSQDDSKIGEQLVIDGKLLSKDDTKALMIEKFREKNEELTDGMEDDKVHQLALKEFRDHVRIAREKKSQALREGAEVRRRDIIEKLSESDKRFAADLRGALSRVEDSEIMSEDFDISDYLYWAKGKHYDQHVKEVADKAREEALKEKKILGKNPEGGSGGGQTPQTKKGASSAGLTPEQKTRALEMYDSLQISDEEKFKMFTEYLKD